MIPPLLLLQHRCCCEVVKHKEFGKEVREQEDSISSNQKKGKEAQLTVKQELERVKCITRSLMNSRHSSL